MEGVRSEAGEGLMPEQESLFPKSDRKPEGPVGIIYLAGFAARRSQSAYRLASEDQGTSVGAKC